MSKKNYILDTNVLLNDHQSIFRFEENNVIVPMVVLEELDQHKSGFSDKAIQARKVARYLDKLSKRGKLSEGVELDNGGTLQVIKTDMTGFEEKFDVLKNDNIIIHHAISNSYNKELPTIVVSMDINVRLKCRSIDILVEEYEPTEIRVMDTEYTGCTELEISAEEMNDFHKEGAIVVDEEIGFYANQFVTLNAGPQSKGLGRYIKQSNIIIKINEFTEEEMRIAPRNREQKFLLDALMDPSVKLVTATGKAGTGKTLLAAAASLRQVELSKKKGEDVLYKSMVIARPVMPLGKDIGFLPGDVNEKIRPYLQPIFDNLEFMMDEDKPNNSGHYSISDLMEDGTVQMEAITFIRGRTFHEQILIIDEAQNLTKHEIKTILTRAGEGTKIVLTGDVQQIDSPFLDQNNNGLSLILDKFKDEAIACHVHLDKGERSELAEISADIL